MQITHLLPAAFALVIFGCGDATENGAPAGGDAGGRQAAGSTNGSTLSATSSRGTFAFELTPLDGPILNGKPFDVTVAVSDPATGAPLKGFDSVTLDARMPAHDHGMNVEISLVPTEEAGVFRADGLRFHMIGHWEFHVDVTRGALMERAQASVTLEH